jgi:hypothetical protein
MFGKLLVWAAVAAGVAGFFMPLVVAERDGVTVSLSALTLVSGAQEALASATQQASDQMGATEEQAAQADALVQAANTPAGLQSVTDAMRSLALVLFAPTILLLLVALFGLKRYGRGLAAVALVAGVAAVGLWSVVSGQAGQTAGVSLGLGLTLILAGGGLGALGGLIKPEPKAAPAA